MDKALSPYKRMTAHALLVPVAREFLSLPAAAQVASLDGRVATWLAESLPRGEGAPFSPLPLMGLPGFCDDNADPVYYDDAATFRPPRLRAAGHRAHGHAGERP